MHQIKIMASNEDVLKAIADLSTQLTERLTAVEESLDEVKGRLTAVEGRLTAVEGRLTAVEGRLTAVEGSLTAVEGGLERMRTLQANSCVSRSEALARVPDVHGELPPIEMFPPTLNHLLVAGSERLPGTGEVNVWNKAKSRWLLAYYGADEGYDSETDNEHTPTARSMRFRIARVLGVTQAQLQLASLSLSDF